MGVPGLPQDRQIDRQTGSPARSSEQHQAQQQQHEPPCGGRATLAASSDSAGL